MAAWQVELFDAIEEGSTAIVQTILDTEDIDVNKKIFFSRPKYEVRFAFAAARLLLLRGGTQCDRLLQGYHKTYQYTAQSTAQTAIGAICSVIGVINMISGAIFAFFLISGACCLRCDLLRAVCVPRYRA